MDSLAEDNRQEVTVRRLGTGDSELAVFNFEGGLREKILSSFREGYLTHGSYVPGAKAVSAQGAMSLTVAGAAAGTTGVSAALSPTLYIATANPSTLMELGNGVGSAVMGAGGIVGQAPFVAVPIALPIIAPIMAVQALNTAVIMQQFKQVDQKLDSIKTTLDDAISRIEATHVGELFAASRVVDDVYQQYSLEGSFSNDMLIRLALAERDMGALAARFRHLVKDRDVTTFDETTKFAQVKYDDHSAMLASLTQLRVSYLRVCVDMQENPHSVSSSVEHLKSSIDEGIEFWQFLLSRSQSLKDKVTELKDQLGGMSWRQRNLPRGEGSSVAKDLANVESAYTSTMEGERELMREYTLLIDSASKTRKALDSSNPSDAESAPTLVYWQDEAGQHAFVTEKPLIS
ncbi:hypothetical protein [Nesterenkonia sp. Act20]|uniref:hypothetical protein n=1 Tax=Nesterenkonia sp. Act20 TaxID=1483432 RepID=UPI001C456A99|nr:hypothetical protein [Nesterenkonia sp. Act20]